MRHAQIQRITSCGSGTFLFHAIRRYLETAEKSGTPTATAVHEVTAECDRHGRSPGRGDLARVTYVLAIGLNRLRDDDRVPSRSLCIWVTDAVGAEPGPHRRRGPGDHQYRGDSIIAGGGGVLFGDDLVFPRSILGDAGRFDRLVSEMADNALDSTNKRNGTLIDPILKRFKVTAEEAEVLSATFATMRALHKSGKDHIWGYYVRNLIRPCGSPSRTTASTYS